MLFFYHGLGVALLLGGSAIVDAAIPGREEPSVERSLVPVLAAGPIEETIFFGIPFYIFGNAYSVLVTGAVWAAIHVLNTPTFEISSLSFGNLFFVIPSLFFSLRTWTSGKGWFAILTHSAWNGIFFGARGVRPGNSGVLGLARTLKRLCSTSCFRQGLRQRRMCYIENGRAGNASGLPHDPLRIQYIGQHFSNRNHESGRK